VDFGKVRVGVAIDDELGAMAHPRPYLDGRNLAKLLDSLAILARDEGVGRFVVGLPTQLDGSEGPPARRARRFAQKLAVTTGCEVELMEEWLTTRQASALLRAQGLDQRKARERIDSASAAVLLQAWLDRRTSRESDDGRG